MGRSACMAPFTTKNLSSIASTLALRPGPYPRISSSLSVRGRFVRSSFDTMPISFPTEFLRFDPTWEKALASLSFYLTMHEFLCQAERPMLVCQTSWPVEALRSLSFTSLCMFLYQAERPMVACHLVSRGCGMTRSCVLGASVRFPTEYDGKRQWANAPCWAHAVTSDASVPRSCR